MILPYNDHCPNIHPSVFVAEGAVISGDVQIGEDTGIWFNSVIRGDVSPTVIGKRVSIQDNATLHQSPRFNLIIEDDVTVGHNAILHSCTVRKGALIGMGAIILDGAEVGEEAMIGAGCLVPPGKKIPPRTVYIGSPAQYLRDLNEEDVKDLTRIRSEYVQKAKYYKNLHSEQQLHL